MKLLFFDLETTGVYPHRNGIHQISGEVVIDRVTKEKFDFKVQPNPACEITKEALSIAGVTLETIQSYPPMKEVHEAFTGMLSRYVDRYDKKDKFFLVGYNNAPFDNQFLRGFFLQNEDPYFGSWFWSNSIDVMVLASLKLLHDRHEMENFKLATVARHLGIEVVEESLHDAGYDISLTKSIFDIICHQNRLTEENKIQGE